MKHLLKRISRAADCSSAAAVAAPSYHPIQPASRRLSRRRSGRVPVYVGEEMERFEVSAELVNHPLFARLLSRSAQEYGYQQKGALHIPCHVSDFERVLHALRRAGSCRGVADDVADELVDSLCADGGARLVQVESQI